MVKLFTQHFNLRKLQKLIKRHLHVAHCMSLVARDIAHARPKFANKHILGMLFTLAKSSNIKKEPCLYATQMLTRIAYHLLGMVDELPPSLTKQALAPQRTLRRLVKESQKGKQIQEHSSSNKGEELEIPEKFEVSTTKA